MAKRKKPAPSSGPAVALQIRNGEHPAITEMLKAAAEDQDPMIGLPLPALAVRYLLQSNVFPLSRLTQLRGEFSSCKSAMLLEIMRWFNMYGGGGILIDTENKNSETMMAGILGHNPLHMQRTFAVKVQSVEEWQMKYMGFCQQIHSANDTSMFPVCIGIDSVAAVDIDRKVAQVAEDGHASAGHPGMARNLSEFCRGALAPTLRHRPIALVLTNHLKQEINSMGFGPPKQYGPGGAALEFYPTLILDMKKISSKPVVQNGAEGTAVQITATKNNLGAPRRQVAVNFMWYNQIIKGQDSAGNDTYMSQQYHYWDWHTASTRLLVSLQDPENKRMPAGMDPKLPAILQQVCDLEYKHGTKNAEIPLVFSKALGISKSEAVSEAEASLALEANPKIVGMVQGLLGVNTYAVCDPALKYREQITEELKKQSVTDVPEKMAAVSRTEALVPSDYDPLGQVE